MKRKQRDGNEDDDESDSVCSKMDPIPPDLEVEILIRLPGKSLMKLKLVSKMWSSIIQSQRFIDSYNAMSSTRSRFIIAFSNGVFAKDDAKRLFIFSSSYEGDNFLLWLPISQCPSVHGFVGCYHGDQFVVSNPSTGQVINVPCKGPRTSLGYDSVDNQFKALTLVSSLLQDHDVLVHEVITLVGGESSWTSNKFTTPPYFPATKGLCINGFVYYGAWAPETWNESGDCVF